MINLGKRLSDLSAEQRARLEVLLVKRNSGAAKEGPIPRRDSAASCPLSFAQQRLWFLDQLEPNNPAYNFSRAIRLTGVLDVEVLERCLVELRRRHEVLRTTFVSVVGEPVQRVSSVVSETLSVRNLGYLLEKSARLSCTGISLQKGSVPSICHRT